MEPRIYSSPPPPPLIRHIRAGILWGAAFWADKAETIPERKRKARRTAQRSVFSSDFRKKFIKRVLQK
jgi:hypothetical protein